VAFENARRTKVSTMPEVRLSVGSMRCRHCVREVTSWLRDVVGVETITADAKTGTVVLAGTMTVADVLAVFAGSYYTPRVVDSAPI
jgi:copper chaperone CopZ